MCPVCRPFVCPVFFSSLDESTQLIPCVRFVIRQNGRPFENPTLLDFSRTDTRFVGWNFADKRDNTKLHIARYNIAEKP